ncbi:MAG: DMT family transporter [Alphaproteobacteria bacterium]|nr:DMT family transporter [Alphaproteobacteria bacterium]
MVARRGRPRAYTAARMPSNVVAGILWMSLSTVALGAMNMVAKLLGPEYPTLQVVWARSLGHFLIVLLAFLPARGPLLFVTRQPLLHIGRSLCLVLSTMCFFTALIYVPLADASAITFTTPLMITALAGPLLSEAVGWRRWTAVTVGFLGALIVIRPGLDVLHPAAFFAVGASMLNALYQSLTRKVGAEDSPATSVTYSVLVGTVALSLAAPFFVEPPRSAGDWALFCALGPLGAAGHYCIARAFSLGPAATIAPFNYVMLITATTLGYLVFDQFPDLFTWIGSAVIVGSALYVLRREVVLRRQVTARPAEPAD